MDAKVANTRYKPFAGLPAGARMNRYFNVRECKRKLPSQRPASPHIKPLLISNPLSPIFNFVKTENGWRLITAHSADRYQQA